MANPSSIEYLLEQYLLASLDDLVDILKAVSQPNRLQILIYSLQKPRSFKELMRKTLIQKTALNIHVNILLEQKLLNKEERGIYRTTLLGEELIRVSSLILKDAYTRKIIESGRINIQGYSKERGMNMKKLISDQILYQNAQLSYIGSMTGVIKYYGLPVGLDDVAGYSGYCFLLNMAEAFTCPSGPTAHPDAIWEEVHKGIQPLGVTVSHWYENESFPETEFAVSSRDQERSKILFEKVKAIIDISGKPVILWGIPVPEYGIVKGYEENTYLVSTFRHLINKSETPIKYDALQAPGCLEIITLETNNKKLSDENLKETLQRAYKFASGKYQNRTGYKGGLSALDVWISHLQQEDIKYYPYHGNSYLGICTKEAFEFSNSFLLKIGSKLSNDDVTEAGKLYGSASTKMAEFVKIFPFGFDSTMDREKREKGVLILTDVKNLITSVVEHLQKGIVYLYPD